MKGTRGVSQPLRRVREEGGPLLLHIAGCERGGRHEQDEELDRFDGVSYLLRPADATFEEKTVLPDFDVGSFAGEAVAEFGGLGLAIGASIGEEDSGHQRKYSLRGRG
jgi:hypothetical protein